MTRTHPAGTALALSLWVATGCGGEATSGASDAPAPAAPARPAPLPREKPYQPVAPQRLGVLPDGLGLPVGSPAPAVEVLDPVGEPAQLARLYARGPALIIFYRGGWCPYCSFQVRELAQRAADFKQRGVNLALISVDAPANAGKTAASYRIPFPVLSDPDLRAHEAFRVLHTADAAEVQKLTGLGLDIEAASGRSHHKFAVPAAFLIVDGAVRWAHADRDYKRRPSVEQLLAVLDAQLPRKPGPAAAAGD